MYLGTGGAPEGYWQRRPALHRWQMQGRLVTDEESQKERARKMGIEDFERKYTAEEMASGDVVLSATGVTTGTMLSGIAHQGSEIWTDTLLMRSSTGTIRWIKARHTHPEKFHIND